MEESYISRNHLFNDNTFNLLRHSMVLGFDISQKPLLKKLPEAVRDVQGLRPV